jgi:hypothetical protein
MSETPGTSDNASQPGDELIAEMTKGAQLIEIDTTGDGVADTTLIDANRNGVVDAVIVRQADGTRVAMADVDEDGEFDFVMNVDTGEVITTDELADE